MSYRVPDSPDTQSHSTHTEKSFFSLTNSDISNTMSNNMQGIQTTLNPPIDQSPSMSANITLIPSHLWSLPYITYSPEILEAASQMDEERVGQLFAASVPSPLPVTSTPISSPQHKFHLPIQPITPYDGTPENLRSFRSQLVNQIQAESFVSEIEKVRFAYQCLGPGALAKMRSSFRCLEDTSIPPEITTLEGFLLALKQRCEDPSLRDQATTRVEKLYQKESKFHDFITLFEDNMVDSIYSTVDKTNWKLMLERRLSVQLRSLILSASDVPGEYHAFVAYLRRKDAGLQEILALSRARASRPTFTNNSAPAPAAILNRPHPHPSHLEIPVSQGGSAMDLDLVSKQKGTDGRLTQQAKDARRTLGRCVWCNKPGHFAWNCPLGSRTVASVDENIQIINKSEELKGQLQ